MLCSVFKTYPWQSIELFEGKIDSPVLDQAQLFEFKVAEVGEYVMQVQLLVWMVVCA